MVQAVNLDTGLCFESRFETADVTKNDASQLKAKSQ